MSARLVKRVVLAGVLTAMAAAPAYAKSDKFMDILSQALGGSSNSQSNGYNNGYDDGYYDDSSLEREYENLDRRRSSVQNSERNLNEAYRQLEAHRQAGLDTSADEQTISSLQQSYRDDLNRYQQSSQQLAYRRRQMAQQNGYSQNGYNNGFNNGYNRNNNGYYRQPYRQSDEDLQGVYQNVDQNRQSMARSELELRNLQAQLDQARAAGQDTSGLEAAISRQQQSYQDDQNRYEQSRSQLYRQKSVRNRDFF